ncbi:MAG: Rieske 2Fe-2S domain-containing protein, partial [Ferrovibrionaceae bacterium]
MNSQAPRRTAGAFQGYYRRDVPPEDTRLTHVGPNTPMGELMRRYWQPVCLSSELRDLPLALRILGEDLVAFRDGQNRIGLMHRHCAHRGASLEFGRIADQGIRCCYHGWHFDIDGTLLSCPGEPPASEATLKRNVAQGAYPAREAHGLVFAYMGPPEDVPEFPVYD